MNRKELNILSLEIFQQNCKVDRFRENLRYILEENSIKQTDLSRAIGVDNQTISNWLNNKKNYRPQWVDYMFRLNEFLFARVKDYNPLNLFTSNKFLDQQLADYVEETNFTRARIKKQDYERHIELLSNVNAKLSENSLKNNGIDYTKLITFPQFHALLENINNNYCKVEPNKRVFKNSKSYLQEQLFDFMVQFLELGNKKIAEQKLNSKSNM